MGRDGVNRAIPLSRFQNPSQPAASATASIQSNPNVQVNVNGQQLPNDQASNLDINALFGMLNSQMINTPSVSQPTTQTSSTSHPTAASTASNPPPSAQSPSDANPLNNMLQSLLGGGGSASSNPNNLLASLMPMVSQMANNMNRNSASNANANNAESSNSSAPNPLNNMMMNLMPMMNQMLQMPPSESGNNQESGNENSEESGLLMRLFSVIMSNLQIPEILGLFMSGNVYDYYLYNMFISVHR